LQVYVVAKNDYLISTDMIGGLSRISQPCTLHGLASVSEINHLTIPSGGWWSPVSVDAGALDGALE
jgi:hypothetical protein